MTKAKTHYDRISYCQTCGFVRSQCECSEITYVCTGCVEKDREIAAKTAELKKQEEEFMDEIKRSGRDASSQWRENYYEHQRQLAAKDAELERVKQLAREAIKTAFVPTSDGDQRSVYRVLLDALHEIAEGKK